eukprot:352850-Chlamydomonas_euryale.AAC.9
MAGHTPTATVPSSAQRQQQQAQRQAPPPPPPQQQQQQQLAPSAASAASDTSAADAAVPTLAPARRKLFGLGMENDRVALLAAAAASGVALAVGVGGLVASLVRRRRARRRAAAVANSVNGAPGLMQDFGRCWGWWAKGLQASTHVGTHEHACMHCIAWTRPCTAMLALHGRAYAHPCMHCTDISMRRYTHNAWPPATFSDECVACAKHVRSICPQEHADACPGGSSIAALCGDACVQDR